MKNLTFVFFFIFTLTNVQAQQISNQSWTLVHERTATWCPFCGDWGWKLKTEFFNKAQTNNVIVMAVHHSGDLTNPTATEFGNNFAGSGQPIFYVDGFNINAIRDNFNQKLDETQLEIDFKAFTPPLAGVGIDAKLSGSTGQLSVQAKVEFLSDVEGGNYFLGLYLLEDIENVQANLPGKQLHRNVLTKSFLPTTFGNSLKSGAVAKGTVFNINASLSGITANRDKIRVVAIIWNKVGEKYVFFNANMVNVGIPASVGELAEKDFLVYQSADGLVQINLENLNTSKTNIVTLNDITGRYIDSKIISDVEHAKTVQLHPRNSKGLHIVTVKIGAKEISRKIFLQ